MDTGTWGGKGNYHPYWNKEGHPFFGYAYFSCFSFNEEKTLSINKGLGNNRKRKPKLQLIMHFKASLV